MPLYGSLKNVCHLYLSMHFLLFYATIFLFTQRGDSAKDKQGKGMIDLESYRKTPLKVVFLKDNYVLPFIDRRMKNQNFDYQYLCPLTSKNLQPPDKVLNGEARSKYFQGWNIKKSRCLTKINFGQENKCKNDVSFSINPQVEEQEKFEKIDNIAVEIFSFAYDVCPDIDYDKKTADSYELEIYKVYVDFNTKQPLHTEHRILNENYVATPDFQTYMKELKLTHYTGTLKRLPHVYMKMVPKPQKPKNALRSFFSDIFHKKRKKKEEADNEDFLIPQMLVPYSHLEQSSARGANLNYLNIRPQYQRLRDIWNAISEKIRFHLNFYQLSRRTTIYTSTSNILMQNNEVVQIQIDNGGKKFPINVPYVWWYLIVTDDGKSIIILLYNVPVRYYEMKFLCESFCNEYGWGSLENRFPSENIHVHCCEASKEFLKKLEFIKSDDIQIKEILNLNVLRKELDDKKRQNEQTKSRGTVSDGETSAVNKQTSASDGEISAVNEQTSVRGTEISSLVSHTENPVSVSDIREYIDFISSGPLLLLRKDITETEIIFSSTYYTSTEMSPNESMVLGCLENISGNDCIHVVPIDNTSEACSTKVHPNVVSSEIACADEGILYTFQYNICYSKNIEDDEKKFAEMPMLYSVCYDKVKKETIYTTHKISSDRLIWIDLDEKQFIKRLETYGTDENVQQDFKNMENTYEKYAEGFKFDKENIVPQMLVPLIDFDQRYAKGANFHFLNTRPQYKRLTFRWNTINKKILQYLLENKWSKDATIYTVTGLDFPESPVLTKEIKLDENFSLRMPMIWGKIITLDSSSITILMYNIPVSRSLTDERRLCSISICEETNWLDIEPIREKGVFDVQNTHVIQCCETLPHILNYFKLFHVGEKFGGRFERLILPKKSVGPETSRVNEDEIVPAE